MIRQFICFFIEHDWEWEETADGAIGTCQRCGKEVQGA